MVVVTSAFCALAQEVIHQHDRQHRFCDRHRADPHARIVTSFGDHLNFFARAVNRGPAR
jgi:UDP-N-acetyl-D-mannosaminuronic acid transferase (WecB/TagA/CpsF family)